MALTVVTACEDKFMPGAIALHNSIKRNTPQGEIDFYCIYYGEDASPLIQKGIKVIDNPPYPDDIVFPVGGRWQKADGYPAGLNPSKYAMPAMYARMMMTKLLPDRERIFWVDADCIIMQSIEELNQLDFKGTPVAGPDITDEANGNFGSLYPNRAKGQRNGNSLGHKAFGCGVMLVNTKVWEEHQITEKCFELMKNCKARDEMLAVVQSILILVVKNDFVDLSMQKYLFDAKRYKPTQDIKIIHFPIVIPWCEYNMSQKPDHFRENIKQFWEPYR